jgi:hypothetical protein
LESRPDFFPAKNQQTRPTGKLPDFRQLLLLPSHKACAGADHLQPETLALLAPQLALLLPLQLLGFLDWPELLARLVGNLPAPL